MATTTSNSNRELRHILREERRDWSDMVGVVSGISMLALLGVLGYAYYSRDSDESAMTAPTTYSAPAATTPAATPANTGTTGPTAEFRNDALTPDASDAATTMANSDMETPLLDEGSTQGNTQNTATGNID